MLLAKYIKVKRKLEFIPLSEIILLSVLKIKKTYFYRILISFKELTVL
jgi:hypothetical protein